MRRVVLVAAGVVLAALAAAHGQAPKRGGVLQLMQGEDPPVGFSIHETATVFSLWPSAPCYSNLVMFDPFRAQETADTIVPELAERWSWQDGYRSLVFFLRRAVKWHDGRPFTAKDVKYTFDVVREAPDAPAKLRLNPRRDWYDNVLAIETPDPFTVTFRLRRPQPSLLMMLASGYSPIHPAHVPLSELRQRCVGTGPFRFKEYVRGQIVELERNPDYFLEGRPFLDGLRYPIITERGTRLAALQAGRLDVSYPSEMTRVMAETARKNAPSLVITEISLNASDNVIVNHKRPPFDNVLVRRALNLAIDRQAYMKVLRHGGAVMGTAMPPRPYGFWGLSGRELAGLPGFRDAARDRADARRLLAEAGFSATRPLRFELGTRAWALQVDLAVFVQEQFRQIGVESTLKPMESGVWYPVLARRDYAVGANLTATGIDDPDAMFYEHYKCGSTRNVTDYCNPEVDRLIDLQSQELDREKRLRLVWDIQRKLEEDVAKPMLGWRTGYITMWPHVKNLVPHHSIYNWARMQDVWLDR
jgi:peptide/nickel transport system substrate-binding protein